MRANDGSPPLRGDQMCRDRSAETLLRLGGTNARDEALARGADQDRQAERFEFLEPRQRDYALLRRLAEADAGIEHDIAFANAGLAGDLQRARKEIGHVLHDVDRRIS